MVEILKYKGILCISILVLIIFCGCLSQKEQQSVTRKCINNEMWDINIRLSWNDETVIGNVEAKYKGNVPLVLVIIEPDFAVGKWPTGYIPPGHGVYTWRSEELEGKIPDSQELLTITTTRLSQTPPSLMKEYEASKILNEVKLKIYWQEANNNDIKSMEL